MKEILGNFLEYIQFHKIPANVLMREIHPLGLVPYSIIMNALAYQVGLFSFDSINCVRDFANFCKTKNLLAFHFWL